MQFTRNSEANEDEQVATTKRHRSYLIKALLTLLFLPILALTVLPFLLSSPVGLRILLSQLNDTLPNRARITIENAQLSWFAPTTLHGVTYQDPYNGLTVRIPAIHSTTAFWGWLPLGRLNLGNISIDRPIASYDSSKAEPTSRANAMKQLILPIWDLAGTLKLSHGEITEANEIAIKVSTATITIQSLRSPIDFTLASEVDSGRIDLKGRLDNPLDVCLGDSARGECSIKIKALDLYKALQGRIIPSPHGLLSGTVACTSRESGVFSLLSDITVENFQRNRERPSQLKLNTDIEKRGATWHIRACQGESPWANFATIAKGHDLQVQSCRMRAIFSLPAILRDFRDELRIPTDITIPQGLLNFNLSAREDGEILKIDSNGSAPELDIRHQGKSLPLTVDPTFNLSAEVPMLYPEEATLRKVELKTPSMTLTGSGAITNLALSAKLNLATLTSTVQSFLPEFPLAEGTLELNARTKPSADTIQFEAHHTLKNFQVLREKRAPILAKNASAQLACAISLTNGLKNVRLESGKLNASWDGSKANLHWRTLSFPHDDSPLTISGLTGSCDLNLNLLQGFITHSAEPLNGRFLVNLSAELSEKIRAFKFNSALQNFSTVLNGRRFQERDARFSGEGILRDKVLTLRNLNLAAQSAQGQVPELHTTIIPNKRLASIATLQGEGKLLLNLAKLSPLLQFIPHEKLSGDLSLGFKGENGQLNLELIADALRLTTTNDCAIMERKVTCSASIEPNHNSIKFNNLSVDSQLFKASLAGRLSYTKRGTELNLQGQTAPDLARLETLLLHGSDLSLGLSGKANRPCNLSCEWNSNHNLLLNKLKGSGSVYIHSLNLSDLKAEPADVHWQIHKNEIALDYTPVANGGRLNLHPRISIASEPWQLTLPANSKLAVQVNIANEFATQWGGYLCPLFADTVATEGKFSVTTHHFTLPLNPLDLNQLAFNATVDVEGLRFTSGKQMRRIPLISKQLARTPITVGDRHVKISCQNGIITPEPLLFNLPGLSLKGEGSIKINGNVSYEIAAEPTSDFFNASLIKQFKGKPLIIPVRGSLQKLELDLSYLKRRLGAATKQILKDSLYSTENIGTIIDQFLPNGEAILEQLRR